MSRNRSANRAKVRTNKTELVNGLSDLVSAVRVSNLVTGGSQLSGYNSIAYGNNYSLLTVNRIILTYLFTGNGLFQTAVQLPIQDAVGKGIEIESTEMSNDDIDAVFAFWEEMGLWEKLVDAMTWARLYGGGALLINTNQDPETPLDLRHIGGTPLEFYDIDRWQLDTNVAYFDDFEGLFYGDGDERQLFYLWGQPIHESRFIRLRGKRAPSYVRRQLRGWGMSEGERMIRDLNLYLKTQDVLYEILDESKVDVYSIEGLANKLYTKNGTAAVTERVQAANQLKNYLNALIIDAKEKYEQKTMTFGGLAEVMQQNRIGIAAALRVPMTKLFGLSASGFNSGEDDLESYNQMVEGEIRFRLNQPVKQLLDLTMSYLWGYIPSYKFKWPSMRVLTETEQEQVKTSKANRYLALYDRGLIDSQEMGQLQKKDGLITIQTKMEQGFLPPQPPPPEPATSQSEPLKNDYDPEGEILKTMNSKSNASPKR